MGILRPSEEVEGHQEAVKLHQRRTSIRETDTTKWQQSEELNDKETDILGKFWLI